METYKVIVSMPGMYQVFYQTGELGVGNGYYQFTVDGKLDSNYREIIACYPIKYTVIILEPDKINLAV
jgi:hypothetical protein